MQQGRDETSGRIRNVGRFESELLNGTDNSRLHEDAVNSRDKTADDASKPQRKRGPAQYAVPTALISITHGSHACRRPSSLTAA